MTQIPVLNINSFPEILFNCFFAFLTVFGLPNMVFPSMIAISSEPIIIAFFEIAAIFCAFSMDNLLTK